MTRSRLADLFSALLVGAFLVTVVMLVTDQNLQTNFGATSPYFSHWYGLLAMGLVTLSVALLLILTRRSSPNAGAAQRVARLVPYLGVAWSAISIAAMVGIVTTYMQVGFPSASEFAKYLFGVTPYPGALPYIPWLYDLLLAVYLVGLGVGAAAVVRAPRNAPRLAAAATPPS